MFWSSFYYSIVLHTCRLKKQELAALAKEAQRSVDESVKIDFNSSSQPAAVSIADQPSKPHSERAKIVISIQEKDGVKQFRVYKVPFCLCRNWMYLRGIVSSFI